MIKAQIIGTQETVQRLQSIAPNVKSKLHQTIKALTMELVANVKGDKLSGQVLQVRTGRLRRSINPRFEEGSSSVYGFVGTNVEYARMHEYGFHGLVTVKEHLRRTKNGASTVQSHSRRVDMPERSFLRSALDEMKGEIKQRIQEAAVNAAKKL